LPVELVPVVVSRETVRALELALEAARSGDVTGFAGVFVRRGGVFEVDIAGAAKQLPVHTVYFVRKLAHELDQIPTI
jgi:hypothetical protein